jgi:hypothetical protein
MHERKLPIPDPCHVQFGEMRTLGAAGRYCESCQHAVVDLSALTEAQAERVIRTRNPDLCVSYLRDESGHIVFRKPGLRDVNPVTVAVGALLSLAACSRQAQETASNTTELSRAVDPVDNPRTDVPAGPALLITSGGQTVTTPLSAGASSSSKSSAGAAAGELKNGGTGWPGAQSPNQPDARDGESCDEPPVKHTPKVAPPVKPPPVRLGGKLTFHNKGVPRK